MPTVYMLQCLTAYRYVMVQENSKAESTCLGKVQHLTRTTCIAYVLLV